MMKDSAMNMQENVVPIETPRSAVIRSDRLIGAILADEGKLTQTEIDRILRLQRDVGIRFGEAAVQLGFISDNDVRFALAGLFLPLIAVWAVSFKVPLWLPRYFVFLTPMLGVLLARGLWSGRSLHHSLY